MEQTKLNCGIYYIQNKKTGQLYIGQSKNLKQRKQTHFQELRNNNHVNTYLQNSFNKYGEESFEFNVIEYCDESRLDELEVAYMNLYNVKEHGFNICDGGMQVCPNNSNENHGMWRQDISNTKIKEMYLGEYNSQQIADYFNCSRRTIDRRLHKIFTEEEFKQLKYKKQSKGRSSVVLTEDIKNDYLNGIPKKDLIKKYHTSGKKITEYLIETLGNDYKKYFPKKPYTPRHWKKKQITKQNLLPKHHIILLYKYGHTTSEIAEEYGCGRHLIGKILRECIGKDYAMDLKVDNDSILKLARDGLNSMEIASKLDCSDYLVRFRLKKIMSDEEYLEFKKRNTSRKMSDIYKKHYTDESKRKRIEKMSKYSFWNGSHVHYMKNVNRSDWNNNFYLRFNARDVKGLGKFLDFVSVEIVYSLIVDFSLEE